MSGKVVANAVKAWQARKADITASHTIFIEKELIGADPTAITPEAAEKQKKGKPRTVEVMRLRAPRVIIGATGEESGTTQKIIIHSEKTYLNNTVVLGEIFMKFGDQTFQTKSKLEKEPLKLSRSIHRLLIEKEEDLKDLKAKAERPGNEEYKVELERLKIIINDLPQTEKEVYFLAKKLLPRL